MDPDSREDFLKKKINILGLEEFVEQNISFLGIESNYKTPSKDKENTSVMFKEGCLICPTYALSFLEPEECEGILLQIIKRSMLNESSIYIKQFQTSIACVVPFVLKIKTNFF